MLMAAWILQGRVAQAQGFRGKDDRSRSVKEARVVDVEAEESVIDLGSVAEVKSEGNQVTIGLVQLKRKRGLGVR